jgi:hypothetical protein
MINLSLAGLIGAMLGAMIAAVTYHLFIGVFERKWRERERRLSAEERNSGDLTLSAIRRLVLTVDLLVFAGLGYWLGRMIGE